MAVLKTPETSGSPTAPPDSLELPPLLAPANLQRQNPRGFQVTSVEFLNLQRELQYEHNFEEVPSDLRYSVEIPRDIFQKDITYFEINFRTKHRSNGLHATYGYYFEEKLIHRWEMSLDISHLPEDGDSYCWELVMFQTDAALTLNPSVPNSSFQILFDIMDHETLVARVSFLLRDPDDDSEEENDDVAKTEPVQMKNDFRLNSVRFSNTKDNFLFNFAQEIPQDLNYFASIPRDIFQEDLVTITIKYMCAIYPNELHGKYSYFCKEKWVDRWSNPIKGWTSESSNSVFVWEFRLYQGEHSFLKDTSVSNDLLRLVIDLMDGGSQDDTKIRLAKLNILFRDREDHEISKKDKRAKEAKPNEENGEEPSETDDHRSQYSGLFPPSSARYCQDTAV